MPATSHDSLDPHAPQANVAPEPSAPGRGDPDDTPPAGAADAAEGDAARSGGTETGGHDAGGTEGVAPEAAPEAEPEEPRRARAAEPPPTPPPPDRLEGAVEAILLAAGEALTSDRIRDLLGLPSAIHVREALGRIRERWAAAGLPVEIQDVAGGHRITTRPEYGEYVRRLWRRPAADRLTATLLETLSIVAYKQPVARAEIERIRGVQCGDALRALLDRRLVKVAGRSDQPGRPLLYATTARFLEVFGLSGLEDLPNAKDLQRM
ncbi:MAG TPA: SMC-Scp complex subunit ScpB [Planctomycetota bacterium]|nr:SMC-Scp complex subunit ScpB [Planctomycetota bacterium]